MTLDEENGNEWHEQVTFSNIYFQLCAKCREAQIEGDLNCWVRSLSTKITQILPILDKKDRDDVCGGMQSMWSAHCAYYKQVVQSRNSGRHSSSLFQLTADLEKSLMSLETNLDILVNKKMPFLNIKERVSIKGL